ncbi:MAG: hypothetical protein RIS86_886 [Planctomycetota bacterium]|jgi:hypothetical protein
MPSTNRWRRVLSALAAISPLSGLAGAATAQPARPAPDGFFARAGGEVRSRHYRILSDLPPDETRVYAEHLDLMYGEYARRLASLPQRAPEVPFVLMFRRQSDYLEVLRSRYGVNGMGSGGMFFISPAGAALAFFTEDLPRTRVLHVVQHEGFHQYAHSRFAGSLPPWVNEGLAEFFGEAIVVDGKVIVGQASPGPVAAIRDAVSKGATVDFLRMLTMDGEAWNANVRAGSAAIQYMQAWSMVQFLGWAEDGRHQRAFEAYLRLLHAGTPSERAFVQAFGTGDVASFERAWKDWASKARPTAFAAAAARLTFLAEGMRALAREGTRATSLEDLVDQLRGRGFAVEVTVHGRTERMTADDALLEIPRDELAKETPVFELLGTGRAPRTTIEKRREAAHPAPQGITTRGLAPRELVLAWTRTKAGDDFEYRLESPKRAPKPVRPAKPRDAKDAPPAEGSADD